MLIQQYTIIFLVLLDAELLRTNRFAMNNQTPINTRSVPSLSTSANLSEVITKVNAIISNLRSFGFFTNIRGGSSSEKL